MGRNVDTKQKVVKLPITEYSIKHNISTATCRNWIKSDKVEFEMVDGKYFIFDYEVPTNTPKLPTNIGSKDLLVEKDSLIQSLTEQIGHQQKELAEKNEQINELLRQQNQNQQIIMSMNQNQKLLVESKRTWIQRLFGLNERGT
jgi:mevalonate kinase